MGADLRSRLSGRTVTSVAFPVALVALYLLARLPFLAAPLTGEEGIMAAIVVNQPAGPNYTLIARIDGQDDYRVVSHPAPLYESMKLPAKLWPALSPEIAADDARVTPRLRLFFSLFQLLSWLAVGLMAVLATRSSGAVARNTLLVVIAATTVSPIALVTSTQLQVDGSVGAVMVSVMAGAVCLAALHAVGAGASYAVLAVAATTLGLGKQEWSLALLGALVLWVGALLAVRRRTRRAVGGPLIAAAVILGGLLLGNLLSYMYNPDAWLGGVSVMRRVAGHATVATGTGPSQWLAVTGARLGMLVTCATLGVTLMILFTRHRRSIDPYAWLGLLLAGGLFGGYFISSWASDPRYFVPSVLAMAFALVAALPRILDRTDRIVVLAAAIVLVVDAGVCIVDRIDSPPGPLPVHERDDRGCVPMLPVGEAWNKPDIDFVARSLGPEGATAHLAAYGKTLCE